MPKPYNPYRKGSVIWSIMEGSLQGEFDCLPGWEDLTIAQIAEVLDTTYICAQNSVYRIKKETGYRVRRAKTGSVEW